MPEENKKEEGIRKGAEKKEMHPEPIADTGYKEAPIDLGITRVLGAGGGGGQRGFRFTVGRKLIVSFLALSLIPIAIIGFTSYLSAKRALQQQALNSLTAIAQGREIAIGLHLEAEKELCRAFASDGFIREILEKIKQKGSESENLSQELNEYLLKEKLPLAPNSYEIMVLDLEGRIVASSDKGSVGSDKSRDDYFIGGKKGVHIKDIYFSKTTGKESLACSAPLKSRTTGGLIGVIVNRVETKRLNAITADREGLGRTGEVYIVNKNGYMITESRFAKNTFLQQEVDTEPVRLFQNQGKVMAGVYPDYRGKQIVGASMGDDLAKVFDLGWTILAEIDTAEAFAPVVALRNWILLITLLTVVVVVVIARMIAMGIVNPLQNTVGKIKEIAQAAGDLTKNVEVRSNDEIGDLGNAFNSMIFTLGSLVRRVRMAAMHIVSASTQILSASQQHAIGAAQQSSQITEVTGALNELVVAAKQVSLSADEVARISDGAVKTAESGSKAVADTIATNTRINNSVKEMAKKVETLGRKSKKITGILDLLDDITEQTNLLAINAAIEAAKAGEAGKGFTVVANEIRKLADSSRKATKDISVLIEEIQADTQETVYGMKESTSLVDEGTSRATSSGDAIKMISFSIEKSAQSVKQIALAAQQQTTGAAQVSRTMADVNAVVKQGMAGTEQSLRSAKDLAAMAEQLKASMAQFRIREQGNHDY